MDKSVRIVLQFKDQATGPLKSSISAIEATLSRVATVARSTLQVGMAGAVSGVETAFRGLSSATSTIWGGITNFIGGAIGKVKGFITGMAQHMKWASLFIGTMATGIAMKILNMAGDIEQSRVAFETLLGSADKAGNLMEWLTKFSLVTPVTRIQLQDLAREFLAYGHNLEETKTAITAVTEAGSALGITETRLQAITYNLGQIAASTTVSYREFRDLQKQGINTGKLLAQAVNDGAIKLSGFGEAATISVGASKDLTKAYESAAKKTKYLGEEIRIAEEKLKGYEGNSKIAKGTIDSLKLSIQKKKDVLTESTGVINKYNEAQTGLGKTIKVVAKNLTELTRDQQEMILEQNNGKDIALALEEQMIKTYGGAALKQVKTFSGLVSNFGDVFTYVLQRAMGISITGEVQIGGAFDKIRNALAKLVKFLLDNVDKIGDFFNKMLSNSDNLVIAASMLAGAWFGFLGGILGPVAIAALAFGGFAKIILDLVDIVPPTKPILDYTQAVSRAGESTEEAIGRMSEDFDKKLSKYDEDLKRYKKSFKDAGETLKTVFSGVGDAISSIGTALTTTGEDFETTKISIATIAKGFSYVAAGIDVIATGIAESIFKIREQWIYLQITMADLSGANKAKQILLTELSEMQTAEANFQLGAVERWAKYQAIWDDTAFKVSESTDNMLMSVNTNFPLMSTNINQNLQSMNDSVNTNISGETGIGVMFSQTFAGIASDADANMKSTLMSTQENIIPMSQLVTSSSSAMSNQVAKDFPEMSRNVRTEMGNMLQTSQDNMPQIEKEVKGPFQRITDVIAEAIVKLGDWISKVKEAATIKTSKGDISFLSGIIGRQHGGIVPGSVGQPIPIMAHGGERITPRGSNIEAPFAGGGGGGGVTINMNGQIVMDTPERVKELAEAVIRILGRQNELARYGLL